MKFSIIQYKSVVLSALLLTETGANPLDAYLGVIEQRAVNCNAVTGVLGIVKALGAPATSFCSSYLSVPATSTVLTTTTPVR
jgi:hypothetical protein